MEAHGERPMVAKKKLIIVKFLRKKSPKKVRVDDTIIEPDPQLEHQQNPVYKPHPKERMIGKLKDHLQSARVKHEEEIMKQPTLKDAHIYCVLHGISAQQYGPLLERYIIQKFQYIKSHAGDCVGDCYNGKGGKSENIEIKASLGGATHTKFNYVQIRLSQKIDYYILTAYHLIPENVEKAGALYIFRVPKEGMKELILLYGGYAHGTVKEHGKITAEKLEEDLNSPIREYAIRPLFGDKCWNALLLYLCQEDDL